MSNNKKMLSFIIILFFVLAGVTVGLIYFAYNITQFTTYSAGTKIANLNISGLYGDEAERELSNETIKWTSEASVKLVLQDYQIEIDPEEFSFNVKESIQGVKSGSTNFLLVGYLNNDLITNKVSNDQVLIEKGIIDLNLDLNKIKRDLLNQVSLLNYQINLDLGNYQSGTKVVNTVEIDNLVADAGFINQFNIAFEIKSKSFSFIETMKPLIEDPEVGLTDKHYSIIASGLYQLILNTNFSSINKHIGNYMDVDYPSYIDFGYEAIIDVQNNKDLTFYNPNPYSYKVTISQSSDAPGTLKFSLEGVPFINEITSKTVSYNIPRGEPIYRYVDICPNGRPSSTGTVCGGSHDGKRIYVIRTVKDLFNKETELIISEDVYMPSYTINIVK